MLKIGSLKLKSNLILSPLAGISDLPYRLLNREFGCELAFVEMLNVRSISYKSKKTEEMLTGHPKDRPLGIQLLGCEPRFILMALEIVQKKYKFDLLDFNAACPVRKVVHRGEGASLLKEPKKLQNLLKDLVSNSKVPVTVKIRSGWDQDSINARDVALICEDAGIAGLFIHGRTKAQEYRDKVDYEIIRKVKKAIVIPVIASGDIFSPFLAKKMFDETGCDAVVFARGALGNPWIFRQTEKFLKNNKSPQRPKISEICDTMTKHLKANIAFYGERNGLIRFRKFFHWYSQGLSNIRPLREKASYAKTKKEMFEIIDECRLRQPVKSGLNLGLLEE
ncbi:MAG: tRNA dihydrouridine synthase DusB [Candidatus Omnitrophota bacterium]